MYGARSLAAGLGGMLKVSSHGAREYEIRNTHQVDSANIADRQQKSVRSLDPAVKPRSRRDAAAELLQAKNEVLWCNVYHGRDWFALHL